MKKSLITLLSLLSLSTFTANAGAFRVSNASGETSDYGVASASVRKGVVTIEAHKYERSIDGSLKVIDRKFFTIVPNTLKASGIEAGSLISIVLNENIYGDVFCTPNKSDELFCDEVVVSARRK